MVGTLSNPVHLDPWNDIIEVGWGNPMISLLAAMRINDAGTAGNGITSCGPDDPPPPSPGYWHTWTASQEIYYTSEWLTAHVYQNGEWGLTSLPVSEFSVSGSPSLPSYNWGAWEWVYGSGTYAAGGLVFGSKPRWQDSGAALTTINGPSGASWFFESTTTQTLELIGDQFTGGPFCYSGTEVAACTSNTKNVHDANAISVAGMSVIYDGRTLTPWATRVLDSERETLATSGINLNLWVLFR